MAELDGRIDAEPPFRGAVSNRVVGVTCCRGSPVDLISSASGMVRPGRLAATWWRQNFPRL